MLENPKLKFTFLAWQGDQFVGSFTTEQGFGGPSYIAQAMAKFQAEQSAKRMEPQVTAIPQPAAELELPTIPGGYAPNTYLVIAKVEEFIPGVGYV